MGPVERRLRGRQEEVMDSLSEQQRLAIETRGAVGAQEAQESSFKITSGLWEALYDLAAEIDQLKAAAESD